MTKRMDNIVSDHLTGKTGRELALGSMRYEALRKLTPPKFEALHRRNMRGENFDAMVDAMVIEQDNLLKSSR